MLGRLKTFAAACLVVSGLVGTASMAAAQPGDLALPADQDWQHQWSAMAFPSRLSTFTRERIVQFEQRQTNVAAVYNDARTGTQLTIYVYRPILPETAIWFDRALVAIGARDLFGSVNLDKVKIGSFVPPGGQNASGQFAVIDTSGTIKSTAVSLHRSGEWLIKLRISSEKLSVKQMGAVLGNVQASLPPIEQPDLASAYLIEACAPPLTFAVAKPFVDPKGDAALALEASLDVMVANGLRPAGKVLPDAPRYCRDGEPQQRYTVYRPQGAADRYVVAFSDAGKSISVFPDALYGAEPGGASAVGVYQVVSGDGLATAIYRPFLTMPSIQQVADTVFRQAALSQVSRPLGGEDVKVEVGSATPPRAR
jgi:hypothetical protein